MTTGGWAQASPEGRPQPPAEPWSPLIEVRVRLKSTAPGDAEIRITTQEVGPQRRQELIEAVIRELTETLPFLSASPEDE